MAFNIPQQFIDDAFDAACALKARQHNRTLPPGPGQTDATPFNERPGALTARQWLIAKQDEFKAWVLSDYNAEIEAKRLQALRRASTQQLAQVDAIIVPDLA